ncbi:MAG: alpha-galactosidase, partial [Prevotella sp.]|nr:alpha-galactosidase [Prevotella sp.]
RFPVGMRCFSDHIHSLGLTAGIYSDAGANTSGSRYDNDENGFGAGLYGHEEQDARLYFGEWNFDFIKIDYCGAGHELNLDEQRRYTEIRDAFVRAGHGDVRMNICRWTFPGTWAKELAGSWRISQDIRPRWASVKDIIGKNMYLSAYCSPGHYNDMDMLEIGRGLTDNEEEVHFGMWCIMSSPLLIGCDLTKISEPSLRLLSNPELIALNQDTLGLQARVVARCGEGYVLAKDIERLHGTVQAVALYNPSDSACHFNVALSELGLGGKVRLRDLVNRKDMKNVRDSIVSTLPGRSVLIMRAETKRRIETSRYEAEWAYLPCFDALGKRKFQVLYARNEVASGGMVVSYLGGRPENTARWTDVWSDLGGRYLLTVGYVPAARRALEISVNGGKPTRLDRLSDTGSMAEVTVPITLHPGYNTIEMGNPYGWAPDIDGFKLSKL